MFVMNFFVALEAPQVIKAGNYQLSREIVTNYLFVFPNNSPIMQGIMTHEKFHVKFVMFGTS